jgi:hypothetical protein
MFSMGLRPLGRYGPTPLIEINFRPSSPKNFLGPRGSQDCEFQRPCRKIWALTEIRKEGRDLSVWQRRKVFDLSDLAEGRQQVF